MSEEHKNCKYRFKSKSCEDCPLNCKFKRLQQENKELKEFKKEILKPIVLPDIEEESTNKYKQALEETLKILCNGRTFYEGYFDNPNLSRMDEAIKAINEVFSNE